MKQTKQFFKLKLNETNKKQDKTESALTQVWSDFTNEFAFDSA